MKSKEAATTMLEMQSLGSEQGFQWLKRALEAAASQPPDQVPSSTTVDSDSEKEDDDHNDSSSSVSVVEETEQCTIDEATNNHAENQTRPLLIEELNLVNGNTTAVEPITTLKQQLPEKKQQQATTMSDSQRHAAICKYADTLNYCSFPLATTIADKKNESDKNKTLVVNVPCSLFLKSQRRQYNALELCQSAYALAHDLIHNNKYVVVLFLRSGRFAAGVFQCSNNNKSACVAHTTSTRYTVRRGQGKAQSAQDNNGRKVKSVGSQLRRAGEEALRDDVRATLQTWNLYLEQASLILISCSKTMRNDVFGATSTLKRDDGRVRNVPLNLGRPSFENVQIMHAVMTTLLLRQMDAHVVPDVPDVVNNVLDANADCTPLISIEPPPTKKEADKIDIPLTPLHIAALENNRQALLVLLNDDTTAVNQLAGEYLMTPLHMAAQANAADCVYELLTTGRADPCLVDIRARLPWFLATHETVRNAFRRARDELGEDYCDWPASKVAAPLTDEDVVARKEKLAEKKRNQRARQKLLRATEKALADALEQERQEEMDRIRQQEDAKRIRDGLTPKTTLAANVCDFCQKACKSRRDMLRRLDYAYCTTTCVERHKRELTAAAAMARLNKT
jgi:hypothetical protein